jgi:hypothetical protein
MTYRDDRLFFVATEDTCAPKQYFDFLGQTRIHVFVLETPAGEGHSSPEHVVGRLEEARKGYVLNEDDEYWLLLDTDHWVEPNHRKGLMTALGRARQQGFQIAISNPCFDLWLLLHHEDVAPAQVFDGCGEVGKRLRQVLGEFNKRCLKAEYYPADKVKEAVRRARSLEKTPDQPEGFFPERTGTRVYRLVERLLQLRLVRDA